MKHIVISFATVFVIFIAFVDLAESRGETIGCQDEDGNLVDWYYLYKLPRKYSNTKSSGLEYLFITPSSQSSWTLSKTSINSTSSIPGRTLSPVYDESINSDLLVVMYNDAPANMEDDIDYDYSKGHTKGVVVANDVGGFWLVHSVPKYPPDMQDGNYGYPNSGTVYGQSFLCISLGVESIKLVGKQLRFNEPNIYSSQLPGYLQNTYKTFEDVLKMRKVTRPPYHNIVTLQTRLNSTFKSFAKSARFNRELYEDLVAPSYKSGDFYVETWQHGSSNLKSNCSKPTKVYNIQDISIKASEKIQFSTMSDHSKWMVSEENNLICVGDINRQEHQKVRGGGTVCIEKESLAKIYGDTIADSEPCRKNVDVMKSKKNKRNKRKRTKVWINREN